MHYNEKYVLKVLFVKFGVKQLLVEFIVVEIYKKKKT
jgi:hypothetical protein